MTEPGQPDLAPLPVEAFRRFPEAAGDSTARVDICGVAVEFHGLPADLAGVMAPAYGPFFGPVTGAGRPLRVEVLSAPIDYFIPPGFAHRQEYYRMLTALDGRVFRTISYRLASWIDLDARRGQIALGSGALDPAGRALENFLRSSVAWLALDAGGFFLHGASIVRHGRCYLFYGPSGAGKSTLAAMSTEGRVISDDLTLILGRGGALAACGGPFRGTYRRGDPVIGSFPVAGLYRLRKDDSTLVRPDDGGCFADLVGNLPFVVDQLPRQEHLLDRVRGLAGAARYRYLHFRKDVPFWPAIDEEMAASSDPPGLNP